MSPTMICGCGLLRVWISADFPVGGRVAGMDLLTKGLPFPKEPGIPHLSLYHGLSTCNRPKARLTEGHHMRADYEVIS